jgi:hypothetical protein
VVWAQDEKKNNNRDTIESIFNSNQILISIILRQPWVGINRCLGNGQ